MSAKKITVLMIGFAGILFGLTLNALAGSGPPEIPCLVDVNSVLLGNSVKGTIAVVTTNENGSSPVYADVDATLRLVWKGKEGIYRMHLTNQPIWSAEDLVCRILEADPVNAVAAQSLSTAVGADPSAFKFNNSSLTGVNYAPVPNAVATSSAMAEAVIYIAK
jgi:hypothetical protein